MAIDKIGSSAIGTDVIAAEDLANNSVTVAEIQDGAVTDAKIAADAVTENKILDGAVSETKLGTDVQGRLDQSESAMGFKNRIIGGNFSTNPWQRGTSFSSVSNGSFSADRFGAALITTGVIDIDKTADAPTASEEGIFTQHCLDVSVTTADTSVAAGDFALVFQKIEGFNVLDLGFGQTGTRYFTLSFWHKHTKTGTQSVAITNPDNSRSYVAEYTQSTSDTWEKAELTIPVDTSGTWDYTNGVGLKVWFCMMIGSTHGGTAGSWAGSVFFGSTNQVNNLDSTSNNFKIALVQLEAGQTATAFENRSVGQELELCQRYFEKSYTVDTAPGSSTETNSFRTLSPRTLSSAVDYMYSVQYKVKKRAGTSVVIYSTDGTSGSVRDISGGSNTTLRSSLGGDSNLMVSFDIIDTRFYAFQWTAGAEL